MVQPDTGMEEGISCGVKLGKIACD